MSNRSRTAPRLRPGGPRGAAYAAPGRGAPRRGSGPASGGPGSSVLELWKEITRLRRENDALRVLLARLSSGELRFDSQRGLHLDRGVFGRAH
jgi:hypothetical protein